MGAVLIVSGVLHLLWLFLTGAEWEGPLSLRKPGLFGVSSGLTVWSIAWVLTKLHPYRLDRIFANAISGALVIEVGLITVQQWRGVPSHFNHSTKLDAIIEGIMLLMILLVTAGIVWLTARSWHLPPMDGATAAALRGGLWLLTLSCGIGIGITILGEWNLAAGKPPEVWGPAGVLKYPHGAVLHAIQFLPIFAWILWKVRVSDAAWIVWCAVASQVLFLSHAIWQTARGNARLELDWIGGLLLITSALLLIFAAIAGLQRFLRGKERL